MWFVCGSPKGPGQSSLLSFAIWVTKQSIAEFLFPGWFVRTRVAAGSFSVPALLVLTKVSQKKMGERKSRDGSHLKILGTVSLENPAKNPETTDNRR